MGWSADAVCAPAAGPPPPKAECVPETPGKKESKNRSTPAAAPRPQAPKPVLREARNPTKALSRAGGSGGRRPGVPQKRENERESPQSIPATPRWSGRAENEAGELRAVLAAVRRGVQEAAEGALPCSR